MKTEDLIEGLNYVSPDYIMETRPEPTQIIESRTQKRDAAKVTEKMTVSHSNAASGKVHNMKTVSATHTNRFVTGIAAAAACAVFACGGWMIWKLKGQQQIGMPESSAANSSVSENISESLPEITEDIPQGELNFLGGYGEIHVLDPQECMYDDTRFYFNNASCYAERNSDNTEYRSMPAETAEFVSGLIYDGSRFYQAKENSLYPVANGGTVSETPFFTLTADILPDGLSVSAIHFEASNFVICKMTEDAYFLLLAGDAAANFRTIACIYHTDGSVQQLTGSDQYWFAERGEDGCVFAAFGGSDYSKMEGIMRIQADGTEEVLTRFSGDTNVVLSMAQYGDQLCILLDTEARQEYGILRLTPPYDVGNIQYFNSDDPDARQMRQVISNGQQVFITINTSNTQGENCSALYSTDPVSGEQKELFRTSEPGCEIYQVAADAHYVSMDFTNSQYAVYDLETGRTKLFRATGETVGDTSETEVLHVDESLYYELDPGFSGTNFLGGHGSLHIPKNGSQILWYDDTNYYFPAGCFPREGDHETAIPAENDMANDYQRGAMSSSGDRLYVVKDGTVNLVDSSGRLTPFFRLADAGLADYHLIYQVFRLGDSYIFPCSGTDTSAIGNNDRCAYIRTSRDGEILETRTDIMMNTSFWAGSSDDISDSVYYMNDYAENVIHRISAAENSNAQTDFTLPGYSCDMDSRYRSVIVSDDKVLYYDQDGNYCAFEPDTGEKAVILAADTQATGFAFGMTTPMINGRLYYMLTDPFSEEPQQTDIMQMDLNTGETQKMLSFDKSYVDGSRFLSQYSNQLFIQTNNGLILYHPETNDLFRLT